MTPINSKTAAAVRMECLRCMDGQEQDHSVLGHFPISTPLRCHWKWTIKRRVRMGSDLPPTPCVLECRSHALHPGALQPAAERDEGHRAWRSIRVSAHVGGSDRGRRRELSLSVIDRGKSILQSCCRASSTCSRRAMTARRTPATPFASESSASDNRNARSGTRHLCTLSSGPACGRLPHRAEAARTEERVVDADRRPGLRPIR